VNETTMQKAPYQIIRQPNTAICRECDSRKVDMLAPIEMELMLTAPFFYICRNCHTIFQGAVGKVEVSK
jgi:hypothetical protein